MSGQGVSSVTGKHSQECASSISAFKRELQKVRTGRASAGLVESIQVEYYGAKTALSHLGQISTPEPRVIMIQVYDAGAAPAVEKAIQAANLGLNPSREGNVLRITIPTLTQESRRDLVKMLHKMAEDIRVSIRNHRRDANDSLKKLEKDGELSKDEIKRATDQNQKQTDKFIQEVDVLLAAKEAECMEV